MSKKKDKPVMADIGKFDLEKFWIVARNVNTLSATMRHSTEASATAEAARLSANNGGTFLIFACVGAITRKEVTQPATMTEPKLDAVPVKDIPF